MPLLLVTDASSVTILLHVTDKVSVTNRELVAGCAKLKNDCCVNLIGAAEKTVDTMFRFLRFRN